MKSLLTKAVFILFSLFFFQKTGFANQIASSKDSTKIVPDTLLFKIEKAQAIITEINSNNNKGFNILILRKNLATVKENIEPVRQDLEIDNKSIDSKTLQSYSLILKDAQSKLTDMRNVLSKSNNDLQRMTDEVVNLSSDSLLVINKKDTTEKRLYNQQLYSLKLKLQDAGKLTSSNLDTVSRMLADVSATYLTIVDLQENINEQLLKTSKNNFKRESPYLWSAPSQRSLNESIGELLKSSYQGQNKILGYFINSTWDSRVLVLLLGLLFFYWVYKNFNNATSAPLKQKIGALEFEYLRKYPFLATIIFILSLTPFFELDSPSLYIELIQFLLLIILTIHFSKTLSKSNFKNWLITIVLYIILIFANAIVTDALFSRLLLIALNISFLYLGYKFYGKLGKINIINKYLKRVMVMFFSFNISSVLLNIFGRISLAKTLSTTAVISLTHVICLVIFIQILTEALELKLKLSLNTNGLFSRLNPNNVRSTFKSFFRFIAIVLWLIVFTINLNITSGILNILKIILNKERTFGSINFTLTNILFFVAIVYISNKLQKHVGILFQERGATLDSNNRNKSSKAALMRLVIILVGIMFAISASGIPMDKLTVVLGALSVGIGLGMQTVVNNFVSGIILIFEKPFRIGDFIEIADKKGKILDIGIRASKMLSSEGSEIIIPNGDLLSGRLVNWTLSNDHIKSEISFKVFSSTDLEQLYKIINEEVIQSEQTLQNRPPDISISSISAYSIDIKISTWVNSIYVESTFKNNLYMKLLKRFKENDIKLI